MVGKQIRMFAAYCISHKILIQKNIRSDDDYAVQEYSFNKLLCFTSSCMSWTILNTESGLASFNAFCDIACSSSAFGPNQSATNFAIFLGDLEYFPHPFSTT